MEFAPLPRWRAACRRVLRFDLRQVCGVLVLMVGAGCRSPSAESRGEPYALLYAREQHERAVYYFETLGAAAPAVAVNLPPQSGNLRTAPRAPIATVTTANGPAGGELRLTTLAPDRTDERVLAAEWAWDSALRDDGRAIAFVAGRDRRQLMVAHAPDWTPRNVPLADGVPGEPRWLGADELLFIRRAAGSELVHLQLATGALRVLARAEGEFSEPTPTGGDVLVIDSPAEVKPGRLLRVPLAGGEPRVEATGFFVPGTLMVSPAGGPAGVAWSADARAAFERTAALRWFGAPPANVPTEIPGVVSAVWSPDGRHLALGRQSGARRWIEVHATGPAAGAPRSIGFSDSAGFGPQWWPATAKNLPP